MSKTPGPTSDGPELPPADAKKPRLSLHMTVVLALVGGIATGLFFGEMVAWMGVVGNVYIGLLQMTVLPYILISVVTGLGRLPAGDGQKILIRTVLAILLFWAIGCVGIVVGAMSFPALEVPAFFSIADAQPSPSPDFVELFVPFNIFDSLARSLVPAIVVFAIFLGLAIRSIPQKESALAIFDVLTEALNRVNKTVARITPLGVFAMVAAGAGTLTVDEFGRLQGYLVAYTVLVLTLTFWVVPSLVSAVTPFSYRRILRACSASLMTAFATAKVLIVIPMLIEETKKMFDEVAAKPGDADGTIDVVYPLAYPFPHLGKLMGLLFIPFAAWFLGKPLVLGEYPVFLGAGVVSYFGGPLVATPFLLSLQELPSDMMQLFLVSGIWCARLGDLLGTLHLVGVTVLTAAATHGLLRLNVRKLVTAIAITVGLSIVLVVGIRAYLASTFEGQFTKDEVLAEQNALDESVAFVVLDTAAPNPVSLEPGQSRVDRARVRGILRIGFVPDNRPFSFHNVEGELVGLDIEMAHELALSTGATLELVPIRRDRIAESMRQDHVDLVMSTLPVTARNAADHELSAPLLELHVGLCMRDDRLAEFPSLAALRKAGAVTIGVVGETWTKALQRRLPEARITVLDSPAAFFEAGSLPADVFVVTAEMGWAWSLLHPDFSTIIPSDAKISIPGAYAVPEGDRPLRRAINTWLELRKRDGTVQRLYDHWILGQTSKPRPPRWSVIRDVLGWVE